MKWLASLLLLSGAAVLMLGMIWTWLGAGVSVAVAPELLRRPQTGGHPERADRLRDRPLDRGLVHSHVEQLADNSPGLERFSYVMVRLAKTTDPLLAPRVPNDASPVSTAAPVAAARRPANIAGDETLPPEIRFGTSRPPANADITAYADEQPIAPPVARGVPINLSVIKKSKPATAYDQHVIVARAGDTLAGILKALGVTQYNARAIAGLLTPSWFGRAAFAGGEVVTVLLHGAHGASRPWEVRVASKGNPVRVAVLGDNGAYVRPAAGAPARTVPLRATSDEVMLRPGFDAELPRTKLDESLRQLAQHEQLAPALVHQLIRLCAHEAEGQTAIAPGDAVKVLYKANAQGAPVLAYADVMLNGLKRRYYRFRAPDDGSVDYYDSRGNSVTKTLMKKPVANGRLGDGFGWRVHPILRDRRFHEGVDYPAPFGSPIDAAGDGVVEKIGEEWGYGKYIRIRHDFGYETTYAHISGIAQGLTVGTRVRRGQVIAYVGSTGLSTGPHLYYELRVDGHYLNPLQADLDAGRVLGGGVLTAFQRMRHRIDRLVQVAAQNVRFEY